METELPCARRRGQSCWLMRGGAGPGHGKCITRVWGGPRHPLTIFRCPRHLTSRAVPGVHLELGLPGGGGRVKGWEPPPLPGFPDRPCLTQVLPACADPRADSVGAHAPWGAPGGPGTLACHVLRDSAGLNQVGRAAEGGGARGTGAALAVLTAPAAPPPDSCLQPLKFCCDYRPYFTIHDSEFKEFTTRTQAP